IWASAKGTKNSWEMIKQASPGNLQDIEEDLAGQIDSSPVILSVKATMKGDSRMVGIAFADASVRELGVSEFADNDLYSNFEVRLTQLFSPFYFATLLTRPVSSHPIRSQRVYYSR